MLNTVDDVGMSLDAVLFGVVAALLYYFSLVAAQFASYVRLIFVVLILLACVSFGLSRAVLLLLHNLTNGRHRVHRLTSARLRLCPPDVVV